VHVDGKKLRPQLRRGYKQTIKRVSESTVSLRFPIFAGCQRASGRWAVQFESFTGPLLMAPECQPVISTHLNQLAVLKSTEPPTDCRTFQSMLFGVPLR